MVVFLVVMRDDGNGTVLVGSIFIKGLLAQRLAQGTHNPWVLGSNPGGPTTVYQRFP